MQNTELRVRVRPRGSVGGRRRDDLHARTGVRYEAGRCAGQLLCVLFFLSRILISPFHRKRTLALSSRSLRGRNCRLQLATFTFGSTCAIRAKRERIVSANARLARAVNVRGIDRRRTPKADLRGNVNLGGERLTAS